eukprot:13411793-Heterocapsa_arctica.AAC.1
MALEEYREAFRRLVMLFPETWHLCVVAEDRCRAEHMARLKRQRTQDHLDGHAPHFMISAPWSDVFVQAARDK